MNLGLLHQKYHFQRLDKKIKFLSVSKKSFLGGMSKLLQLYRGGVRRNDYSITQGGVCPNDYNITWGGSLGTPKSDYVICARPLTGLYIVFYYSIFCKLLLFQDLIMIQKIIFQPPRHQPRQSKHSKTCFRSNLSIICWGIVLW